MINPVHLKRATELVARAFEIAGGLFLLAMMLVTVADIALRAIDPMWRIFGVVELVQLFFDWMIFLGVPAVFLLATNLTVNLFDDRLGARGLRLARRVAGLVSVLFLLVLINEALIPAMDSMHYGDETQDLRIPLAVYWLPILLGLGIAFVAALRDLLLPDMIPIHDQMPDI